MSEAPWFQPTRTYVNEPKLQTLSRGFRNSSSQVGVIAISDVKTLYLTRNPTSCSEIIRLKRGKLSELSAWTHEGPLQELEESPVSVELKPICSESQFDQVISRAQLADEAAVVVWMASWCRKFVHLKPKLEKLAADYYPRLWFYCVDVNKVPHKLVARAEVTKMPTIQLWKTGAKQGEVIGGRNKAYLVVNEIRDMIESESTT